MAALDFPATPTIGDVYTANGRSWVWNGTTWDSYGVVPGLPPGGLAGQALVKASAADYDTVWDTPLTRAQGVFAYAGSNYQADPGLGGVAIDVTGQASERGLAFSGTDLQGKTRDLSRLLVGDTLILSNAGGFARYIITTAPVVNPGWYSIGANRTDTGGTTTPPPVGTQLVATFTLGGTGG